MCWLREQFGDDVLHADVVLPTADHLPGEFAGDERDAHQLLAVLCDRMAVDPGGVAVEVTFDSETGVVGSGDDDGEGHYLRLADGRQVIDVNPRLLTHPVQLTARIAHDLGHARLLGEERITSERRDHEQLADLLTVYFGLGVFTANASYDTELIGRHRRMFRMGFLPEPLFGYALACYAWMREEPWADWMDYLDHNPRATMKDGLSYLKRVAEPGLLPCDREVEHPPFQ